MTAAHEIISDDPALGEDELVALARRCWEADGGLPLAAEPWFVRGRWSRPGTKTFTVRASTVAATSSSSTGARASVSSPSAGPSSVVVTAPASVSSPSAEPSSVTVTASGSGGPLAAGAVGAVGAAGVAAGAVGAGGLLAAGAAGSGGLPAAGLGGGAGGLLAAGLGGGAGGLLAAIAVRPGPHGSVVTGLVDPAVRGRGIGARLLDAALVVAENGAPEDGFVTVETEGLSPDAEKLFESRGLRQFFAEDVMRIDLAGDVPPEPVWPAGAVVAEWSGETAERFFRVYAASFRERPGFPDPSAQEWIEETAEDDDFRPAWSLLATLPEIGDAGFVSVGDNWIQQVGVVPAARRTGLGGALIRESLRRMAGAGLREGWLCVNVDNAAASLYRRIGFQDMGRRARYRPVGS
jgi:mycothiol synthase